MLIFSIKKSLKIKKLASLHNKSYDLMMNSLESRGTDRNKKINLKRDKIKKQIDKKFDDYLEFIIKNKLYTDELKRFNLPPVKKTLIEISSELTQGNFEQYYFPATAVGFLDMLRYLLKHWNDENKKRFPSRYFLH